VHVNSELLHDKLKLVIESKCQGQLSKSVMLLHDNAHSHTAVHCWNTPPAMLWILEHPPHSDNLALSDSHQSGPFKGALRHHCFTSNHKLKEAVYTWLPTVENVFSNDIYTLVQYYLDFLHKFVYNMKSTIFWDITPCSSWKVNRRFGGTHRLHLQGRRISHARNPQHGRDMFLWNISWHSLDYMALHPRG
jgi:hypothetical protein